MRLILYLTVTLLALMVILSNGNFGSFSTNPRLNFGRKGGKEAGCFVDESCLEQGVSGANGCFKLSHLGLGSGDWYVRQ